MEILFVLENELDLDLEIDLEIELDPELDLLLVLVLVSVEESESVNDSGYCSDSTSRFTFTNVYNGDSIIVDSSVNDDDSDR